MNTKKELLEIPKILIVLLLAAITFYSGYKIAQWGAPRCRIVRVPAEQKIQNIFEIQQALKDRGLYEGKVDGIWGEKTDKAYCDYCAIQHFKGD